MASSSSDGSSRHITGLTKFKAFADRLAATKILDDHSLSRCPRVSVEGYDISIALEVIRADLGRHFCCGSVFCSCESVIDVVIEEESNSWNLKRSGLIYFRDESAKKRALALSGSDLGGCRLSVTDLPNKECEFSPAEVASARRLINTKQYGYIVSGYDTSLPADDVKKALFTLFSSCGEIIYLTVEKDPTRPGFLKSSGYIRLLGDDASYKAQSLSGRDMGGWKLSIGLTKSKPFLADRLAAKNILDDHSLSRQFGFTVTGYDTLLRADHVKKTLITHFSSCGEIIYLSVDKDSSRPGFLRRSSYIRLSGDDVVEKALRLNGRDLGGWKVVVETAPPPTANTDFPTIGLPPGCWGPRQKS